MKITKSYSQEQPQLLTQNPTGGLDCEAIRCKCRWRKEIEVKPKIAQSSRQSIFAFSVATSYAISKTNLHSRVLIILDLRGTHIAIACDTKCCFKIFSNNVVIIL